MNLIRGYWKSSGKIPLKKEKDRELLNEPPVNCDYVAVYKNDLVARIDIDDFSHKTGELEQAIRGKPRSEAVLKYLDDYGYKYIAIRTEHGVHIVMRKPEKFDISTNKLNWFSALGIKIEIHVTKVFEPLRVNGIDRQVITGNLLDADIDELAIALIPIQKSGEKPFLMKFEEGDRNSHYSEYALRLGKFGLLPEDVKEILQAVNEYIAEVPLEKTEMETILRPETLEKIEQMQKQKNNAVTPELFKDFLKSLGMKIRYNELLNIVEYDSIPQEFHDITDVQNVMPIQLMYKFREFAKKQNINKHQMVDLILLEADTHTYNPVKQFLQSCVWDKKDRFPALFDILGVSDEIEQIYIKKWFFQTVALAFNEMENPLQAEGVLILQGAEGIGKTRFFQQMAVNPMWFSSLSQELNTKNKDVLIQMLSVWIAEIGEIDRTFKSNKSDVKSFITSRDDTIRKPYRMEATKKSRTTSFCGTTNKATILNDDTGSRRWWIVQIKKKIIIDDFASEENLNQFWAQCYHEYKTNQNCFRLTDDELQSLKEKNKSAREFEPAEEVLRSRFNFEAYETEWHWVTASALKNLPELTDISAFDVRQIGQALTSIMGDDSRIQKKRSKTGTKYFVPPAIMNTDRYRNN